MGKPVCGENKKKTPSNPGGFGPVACSVWPPRRGRQGGLRCLEARAAFAAPVLGEEEEKNEVRKPARAGPEPKLEHRRIIYQGTEWLCPFDSPLDIIPKRLQRFKALMYVKQKQKEQISDKLPKTGSPQSRRFLLGGFHVYAPGATLGFFEKAQAFARAGQLQLEVLASQNALSCCNQGIGGLDWWFGGWGMISIYPLQEPGAKGYGHGYGKQKGTTPNKGMISFGQTNKRDTEGAGILVDSLGAISHIKFRQGAFRGNPPVSLDLFVSLLVGFPDWLAVSSFPFTLRGSNPQTTNPNHQLAWRSGQAAAKTSLSEKGQCNYTDAQSGFFYPRSLLGSLKSGTGSPMWVTKSEKVGKAVKPCGRGPGSLV